MSTLLITQTSLPAGTKGVAYTSTLTNTGGTGPFTWAVLSGTLPTGLTIASSTGIISGTPTIVGTASFDIECSDSANTAVTTFTIQIVGAYNGSKASEGMGSSVLIGPLVTAIGTPSYVAIGELVDVDFSGSKRTVLDPTNMQSGGIVEKLDTLLDNGNVKLTMNRITNDPGQIALAAAYTAGGKYLWQVQEPIEATLGQTSVGNLYSFAAIINEGPNFKLDPKNLTQVSYSLDISGGVSFTPGS